MWRGAEHVIGEGKWFKYPVPPSILTCELFLHACFHPSTRIMPSLALAWHKRVRSGIAGQNAEELRQGPVAAQPDSQLRVDSRSCSRVSVAMLLSDDVRS